MYVKYNILVSTDRTVPMYWMLVSVKKDSHTFQRCDTRGVFVDEYQSQAHAIRTDYPGFRVLDEPEDT